MQLNTVIFPAPTCSYSSEKLFKDLVYIPKPGAGEAVPCLYLPYDSEAKLLLFFHGNAEDIGIAYEILMEVRNCLKLSVLAMEYPGYGLYDAKSSSEQVNSDALHVFDHLTKVLGVHPKDIVVFGRSIGCSPACLVARERDPCALLLMSPFKSIREVARDLVGRLLAAMVAERFRNIDVIRDIRCPVFFVHGQRDRLIPFQHSQELHDACTKSAYTKLLLPPRMDHNDFNFDEDFIEPLYEFFKQTLIRPEEVLSERPLTFVDDYYFPPAGIIRYEKKLIKSSIIWDIIEERSRQLEARRSSALQKNNSDVLPTQLEATPEKAEQRIEAGEIVQTRKDRELLPSDIQRVKL